MEQRRQIEDSKLAKTCYKIDYSFLKEEKKKDTVVHTTEVFLEKDDSRYFEDFLNKEDSIKDKDEILELFTKIKQEADK